MSEDSGTFNVKHTAGTVKCCKCGVSIAPNAANMCVDCLRSEFDITEGLQKQVIIYQCPECARYLQPPRTWIKAELESKPLLTFCAKRVKNLNKVKLINAEFIWTEPLSKRLKAKLTVQKEVLTGVVLQQAFVVEYAVQDQMCESCSRVLVNTDQWVAVVQLKQHVSHRITFLYLEQVILKHNAATRAIRIKQTHHGLDFFFANRIHAVKFVEFIQKVVPVKSRHDKQLLSHDAKSNNYNYKYTFAVEICPICREDLVCLPPKLSASLGHLGPFVVCIKVNNNIALVDPLTLRHCFIDAEHYFRAPFTSFLSSKQLVEYVVLDVEPISEEDICGVKYVLADAQVARVSDFGKNDTMFFVRTHLGHVLSSGDYALGYDLNAANNNDIEVDKYKGLVIPEVVLVKKSYEEKRLKKRGKPRSWKMKKFNIEVDASEMRGRVDEEKEIDEYEKFLRDIEENPDLRFNISLYRNEEYQSSEMASVSDGEDEDVPSVPLWELLDDLKISDEVVADDADDDGVEDMKE